MKTLYLDLGMGAAGDMLTAALLELLDEAEQATVIDELNAMGLDGLSISRESVVRAGIRGTHMRVIIGDEEEGPDGSMLHHSSFEDLHANHDAHSHQQSHDHIHSHDYGHDHTHSHHHGHEHSHAHDHDHGHDHDHTHSHTHDHAHGGAHDHEHHHAHANLDEITHIVSDHLKLDQAIKDDVLAVYGLIADAESRAHGVSVSDVHFHEVGTKDAIADVAAVSLLMHRIAPERVIASPVHVGSGTVRCAHGLMPVPAPATTFLLEGVPIYSASISGELCTPTGAALIRHFVDEFAPMPLMRISRVGYGMGMKEFEQANCVRALLGESEGATDVMLELSCNVDDMTAEETAFACEELLASGATEAYTVAITMKKGRPGLLIRALCEPAMRDAVVHAIFAHTTTIGVREIETHRFVLDRSMHEMITDYGPVSVKESRGYGVIRRKYEYEDLARIAREQHMPLIALKESLRHA